MLFLNNPPEKQSNNEKRLENALGKLPAFPYGWIFCVRQMRWENPDNPDWPYFSDFTLCATPPSYRDFDNLKRIGESCLTFLNVEADGDFHGGMTQRARDYKKDPLCFYNSEAFTLRFDSQKIFKDADDCAWYALAHLLHIHAKRIQRARNDWRNRLPLLLEANKRSN